MQGGKGGGAPKGNRNARKHGARSAETLALMARIRAPGRMLHDAFKKMRDAMVR
jgi:uncharacterized protein YjcR